MISKSEVDNLETLVLFLYLHAFFQHTSSIHIATTPDGPVDSFCIAWYQDRENGRFTENDGCRCWRCGRSRPWSGKEGEGNIYKNIGLVTLVCVMSTVP